MTKKEREKIQKLISEREYPCGFTDGDIREAAKGLVASCVRNTVLEDYHAEQAPITDERMKEFMIECVNNVYYILTGLCCSDGEIFSGSMVYLKEEARRNASRWNDPEIPESVYQMIDLSHAMEMQEKQISIDELYAAIVEFINDQEERFRIAPVLLVRKVCKERFGIDFSQTGIDDFDIYLLIREKAKENGYAVREAPSREEKWGLPYVFDCFFYPNKRSPRSVN